MQSFNFGVRTSTAHSDIEQQSRYVPSSIYSGPGPVEESPLPTPHQIPYQNGGRSRNLYEQQQQPLPLPSQQAPQQTQFVPLSVQQARAPSNLNTSDPVTMHLLMETAIVDSKTFHILSFEELESLKKKRGWLRTKVEGVKRQLALERKMKEAALELNRLYSTPRSSDESHFDIDASMKQNRTSVFSRKNGQGGQVNDELNASTTKIEKLTADLRALEQELQDVEQRILQHTAGVLQMTHRGLKKNIRKNDLPRSPESMASQVRSPSQISDFDERSLYQVPDYVHEMRASPTLSRRPTKEVQPLDDIANRLHTLNTKIHGLIQQAQTKEYFDTPPNPAERPSGTSMSNHIKEHLMYMSHGLEVVASAHQAASQSLSSAPSQHVDHLNTKLNSILERTSTATKSPVLQEEDRGHDLQSQMEYSDSVLERLNARVDAILEQKEILTRQIQQQRELNSKSDAQRDAQIHDLTEELAEAQQLQNMSEQEMQQAQSQISLLMEQLDRAKQDEVLLEQQRGMKDSQAVELERNARKEMETNFLKEIEARQHDLTQLQADHSKSLSDFELRSQQHTLQMNELSKQKEQAELDVKRYGEQVEVVQTEMRQLEAQVVSLQTELTMAKAELDGAYGTRAQRANDVSMNPVIKQEIDSLNARNTELEEQLRHLSEEHETKGAGSAELQNKVNALQKELRDTIEDYEVMTKASIDFEKERDRLEADVDTLRERCEELSIQINEDQVKWLGVKQTLPSETVSTIVLKNEFKKMMRDSRAESMKLVKAEQEERRRLEGIIRGLKKETGQSTPSKPRPKPNNS